MLAFIEPEEAEVYIGILTGYLKRGYIEDKFGSDHVRRRDWRHAINKEEKWRESNS